MHWWELWFYFYLREEKGQFLSRGNSTNLLQMSRTTFTDNIVNLAVERLLVRRLWTLFTPQMVCDLSSEQLREMATEAPHVKARRRVLEQEIEALDAELKYWRRFRPTKAYCKSNASRLGLDKNADVSHSRSHFY